jgi:hypothetical protein
MVEVALAVLIIGFGLMVMFGLLPSALRLSEEAEVSTRNALFAETVLSSLEGAAAEMKAPGVWDNLGNFQVELLSNNVPGVGTISVTQEDEAVALCFPAVSGTPTNMRYRLFIADVPGSLRTYSASLILANSAFGDFLTQDVFHAEFTFMGL